MTREEAYKLKLMDLGKRKIIDKIFDYFENRSCESCKHWNKTYKDWYVCTNDICPCYCNATDDDFCCKYYERKTDATTK